MNNIFDYATKELTQDAMIMYLLNYWDKPNVAGETKPELAYSFIRSMVPDFPLEMDEITEYKVLRQVKNIDLLVIINDKYAVLIEDKTRTFEHNQFPKYVNAIKYSTDVSDNNIFPVYFKSGYWTEIDRDLTEVDLKSIEDAKSLPINQYDSHQFLAFLDSVKTSLGSDDPIITLFAENFKKRFIDVNDEITQALNNDEWSILRKYPGNRYFTQQVQYMFMDRMFAEREKPLVENARNTPYTNYDFYYFPEDVLNDVHWRIENGSLFIAHWRDNEHETDADKANKSQLRQKIAEFIVDLPAYDVIKNVQGFRLINLADSRKRQVTTKFLKIKLESQNTAELQQVILEFQAELLARLVHEYGPSTDPRD